MLRYTHAAPFHERLLNEASLEQSTNQLYPTIFSFPLASLLRKSIALHSLWFLNSVQHSMQEMFQRVVHILLISFPGVASLVSGYSRAAAASLGMWHLRVHLLGQNFCYYLNSCLLCEQGPYSHLTDFILISYINKLFQLFDKGAGAIQPDHSFLN